MWTPIFELAKTTALIMTITADAASRLLTVTVTPKPVGDSAPAELSQPITLKGTAEELDEGFVASLARYGNAYGSLKETVDASITIMEQAKADTVRKAAEKAAQKGAPKATTAKWPAPTQAKAAAASVDDEDDADGGSEADDEERTPAAANTPATPASTTPNLFEDA